MNLFSFPQKKEKLRLDLATLWDKTHFLASQINPKNTPMNICLSEKEKNDDRKNFD